MKKTSSRFLIGVGLSAVLLAGCNKLKMPGSTPTGTGDTADEMTAAWTDALKSGQGVICTFTNDDTAEITTAKIKNQKSHITVAKVTDTVPATEMVNDTQYMYTWEPAKKTGFKMKLPSAEDIKKMSEQNKKTPELENVPDLSSPEKIQELEKDGAKVDCTPSNISDSEFAIPTDVTFQDYSAMMNKAMESAKEGMSDEQKKQVEDAMKQYQQ